MQTEIFCTHCNECYSDGNLPRLLIACGHTYCQQCILTFIVKQQGVYYASCPQDDCKTPTTGHTVKKFPKNLALIKAIQNKKNDGSFKDMQIDISKITKHSSNNEQLDNQLINILNEPRNQKLQCNQHISNLQQIREKHQLCQLHKKPLDIVCIVDLKKICSSCAIFGKHKGHNFKSLEEVSQIHKSYCDSLNKIMNQKQKLTKQINCNQTKNDILSLLTSKKDKLKKKINQEFSNLQNKLMKKKKQIMSQLDQISKKQQLDIKNSIKFGQQLTKNYQFWHQKSKSQLKILSENDFEAKLILLFEGKNIDGDIIQEGHSLIKQMKIEEQKILLQVQKKLEGLNLSVNNEIYSKIQNFISVKSEQQPSNIEIVNIPKLELNPEKIHRSSLNKMQTNFNSVNMQKRQCVQFVCKENSNQYKPVSPQDDFIKKSASQLIFCSSNSPNSDESLLQNQEKGNQHNEPQITMFQLRLSNAAPLSETMKAPLSQRFSLQTNTPPERLGVSKIPKTKQVPQFRPLIKMDKKKLTRMKLSEKCEKIVQALVADSLQTIDFTNAQLGDSNLSLICENIGPKAKTLKLIRNKLTDEGIAKILLHLGNIVTLNLSQNLLTDNVLDILYENKKHLPNLKTLIVSQNKIVQRKHKTKIDKIKKLQWNISI